MKQFEVEFQAHHERENQCVDNKAAAAALLWNQCTNTMKAKVQSRKDYDSDIKDNPIKLLQAIKQHAMSFESTQYRMKTICDAMKTVLNQDNKKTKEALTISSVSKHPRMYFIPMWGRTLLSRQS